MCKHMSKQILNLFIDTCVLPRSTHPIDREKYIMTHFDTRLCIIKCDVLSVILSLLANGPTRGNAMRAAKLMPTMHVERGSGRTRSIQ